VWVHLNAHSTAVVRASRPLLERTYAHARGAWSGSDGDGDRPPAQIVKVCVLFLTTLIRCLFVELPTYDGFKYSKRVPKRLSVEL